MEASLAAPSIDETSPAAGEERCVSLDEISDCAPRQDSQERRDVSSENARGADGAPKRPLWTPDEDELPRTVNGTGHTGPSEFCATSL